MHWSYRRSEPKQSFNREKITLMYQTVDALFFCAKYLSEWNHDLKQLIKRKSVDLNAWEISISGLNFCKLCQNLWIKQATPQGGISSKLIKISFIRLGLHQKSIDRHKILFCWHCPHFESCHLIFICNSPKSKRKTCFKSSSYLNTFALLAKCLSYVH
jgi:hypothetical protein